MDHLYVESESAWCDVSSVAACVDLRHFEPFEAMRIAFGPIGERTKNMVSHDAFGASHGFPGQKFLDPVQEKLVVETPGQLSENAVRPKLRGDF